MRALLSAGGTGGHLFPAEALAGVLRGRGHTVDLVTAARARPLLDTFPADRVHMVPAATLSGRNPVAAGRMALTNAVGLARSLAIIARVRPHVAVGFGGYPTLAPLTAAQMMRVPSIVHEANAVAGRANRRLARRARVAASFPQVKGLAPGAATTLVGMPVRQSVREAVRPYETPREDFRLLVFGGSQGARAFAELVPPAVAQLAPDVRARLQVVQQCRPEDLERTRAAYEAAAVTADLAPFFRDLPLRMAAAHFVICRAGAGTVAELAVIGRPALLVPLPGAIDQDQAHNAAAFAAAGGGITRAQEELNAERLSGELSRIIADPDWLAGAAAKAATFARADAAERLADLAERTAEEAGR